MTSTLIDALRTFVIAFGFAACGDAILVRRSQSLSTWNQSFLVGAGAVSALLALLSRLLPGKALTAILALLALAAIARCAIALRSRQPRESGAMRLDPVEKVLALLLFCVLAAFLILNAISPLGWDGFQIWATKALVLAHQGGIGPEPWPDTALLDRLVNYPPLIPLFEALVARLHGGFDFGSFQSIFGFFYLSLAIGTYGAARRLAPRPAALAATLLLLVLPAVTTSHNPGGYADLPLAAFVAASAEAALGGAARVSRLGPRRPGPTVWLLGSLPQVKNEGILLLVIFVGAALLYWWLEQPPSVRSRLRQSLPAIAVLTILVGARWLSLHWFGRPDPTYHVLNAASTKEALRRIGPIAILCSKHLADWRMWGLFWPAFATAGGLLWRRRPVERTLVAAVVGGAVLDACPYLWTTWPLGLHIDQSYPRLLEQIAPVAAVAMATAYGASRQPASAEFQSDRNETEATGA